MSFTLLVGLLAAANAAASDSASLVTTAPSADSTWSASVQLGGGRLGEDPMALVRPRLGLATERFQLTVSAPLYVQLAELEPGRPTKASMSWQTSWEDPDTYAAFVESLHWRSEGGAFDAYAGQLRRELLGRGALVDGFTSSTDPARARTGIRTELVSEGARVTALMDSLARPGLVASGVELMPLTGERRDRLSVSFDAAADVRAPGVAGEDVVGGAALTLAYAPLSADGVRLEVLGAAGSLFRPAASGALGGQLGVALRLAGELAGRHDELTLRLEGIANGEGYEAAYFDGAYSWERFAHGATPAKADVVLPEGYGARGALTARLGLASLGASMDARFADGRVRASSFVELDAEAWRVALALTQRDVREPADLASLRGAYALVDVSARLVDAWFAFACVHHGWRFAEARPLEAVTDWVLGVGYGASGTL